MIGIDGLTLFAIIGIGTLTAWVWLDVLLGPADDFLSEHPEANGEIETPGISFETLPPNAGNPTQGARLSTPVPGPLRIFLSSHASELPRV